MIDETPTAEYHANAGKHLNERDAVIDAKELATAIGKVVSDLQAIQRKLSIGEPTFPKHARERLTAGLCLKCGKPLSDGKGKPARGNHAACYQSIIRTMASSGELEEDAISKGLLAPSRAERQKAEAYKLG